MQFQDAVRTCLTRYADFTGRAARSEFWWFALFHFLVVLVASALHRHLGTLVLLALMLPSLAVAARRLHDSGKSGWFLLLHFIPVVGNLLLLYWLVQPGDGPNQFGEPEVTRYSAPRLSGPRPD